MRLLKTELLTELKSSKTELVKNIDSLYDASSNQQIQCLLCCEGKTEVAQFENSTAVAPGALISAVVRLGGAVQQLL